MGGKSQDFGVLMRLPSSQDPQNCLKMAEHLNLIRFSIEIPSNGLKKWNSMNILFALKHLYSKVRHPAIKNSEEKLFINVIISS